jgi:outer membrane lipoprotein carrier protein
VQETRCSQYFIWLIAGENPLSALHVSRPRYVKDFVSLFRYGVATLAVSAFAAAPLDQPALNSLLNQVEARYNHSRTMEVSFIEQYTPPNSPQRKESGTLYLRKPGRMRCEYALPKGKLCISDGTFLYLYTPTDNRAMKMKLKDSLAEDMRAPLAFLLGKLNFDKEFRNLQGVPEGDAVRISGQPKNEVYASIEFLVAPDKRIQELKITSVDHSILDFTFSDEKQNPPISDKLFAFQLPAGAQWDESSSQ